MEKNARRDVVITDIDALAPKDHLLRKIEKVMDYGWIYERLDPCYTHVGRPPVDPVITIKMAPLRRLYGIVSLRETRRTDDSIAFRWFLEYNLFDRTILFSDKLRKDRLHHGSGVWYVRKRGEWQFAYEAHTAYDRNSFGNGGECERQRGVGQGI